MFSKKVTQSSTITYLAALEQLKQELATADAVVVGAGSGLSTAAGYAYSGERFEKNFPDFIAKYHLSDMYSAGFYPFPSLEEYWAYWSRHILLNRYQPVTGSVYDDLLAVVRDKEYFVITTNVDHCFQTAGFDQDRLFCTQGDYGLWQCSQPCHQETHDNEAVVRRMAAEQREMRIPTALIPTCPRCGRPMVNNLRCDNTFVEDQSWHAAADRYQAFLNSHRQQHILFLELGVGGNTPVIIKYPFWQMTYQNSQAFYACVNLGEVVIPPEIAARSSGIDADLADVVNKLRPAA